MGTQVIDVSGAVLSFKTAAGRAYSLRPVAMRRMPSDSCDDWLRFQGAHVEGTQLGDEALARIQLFMRAHRTEALTDGDKTYTVAGGMLAYCDPKAIV